MGYGVLLLCGYYSVRSWGDGVFLVLGGVVSLYATGSGGWLFVKMLGAMERLCRFVKAFQFWLKN